MHAGLRVQSEEFASIPLAERLERCILRPAPMEPLVSVLQVRELLCVSSTIQSPLIGSVLQESDFCCCCPDAVIVAGAS